ncbi:MAG: hypothetical protein JRF50_12230 [Deltaproteobacteria bacterium]|nr:hypothetical protein [Deltaproteobacteria bacterium]
MLHTASAQQIRDGLVTGVYFERTIQRLTQQSGKGVDEFKVPQRRV